MKIKEEQPAMSSDAVATNATPFFNTLDTNHQGKTWKMFNVKPDVFRRFQTGRQRFERWSKFLDFSDEVQNEIYDYVKKYNKNTVILRCEETGALRAIRRKSSNGL